MPAGPWIAIAALILANALYVSAEFGAVGVRRSRVRRMSEDGHRGARLLLPFVDQPAALDRYVSASQIGITLSSLTLGAYAQTTFGASVTSMIVERFGLDPAQAITVAQAGILLALSAAQIVLGELMPKALALQHPTEVALFTVWPMRWSLQIFRPFIALLNGTANAIVRVFGAHPSSHRHVHSPDEIELLIAESRDGGLLEPDEHRRLHRALRLRLRNARDLMVPLDRLAMLHIDTPWEQVLRTVAAHPFSRLPVYRESRDRIAGTLRVKDLVARYVAEGPVPLQRLLRPVAELRAEVPADRVVTVLRERRVHQAVVVDDDRRAIGLVTIQDVLSELLGAAGSR